MSKEQVVRTLKPSGQMKMKQFRLSIAAGLTQNRLIQMIAARKTNIMLLTMGFLLGRAMVLGELTPFALAYFACIYFMRSDLLKWTGLALLLGSFFSTHGMAGTLLTQMLVFMGLQKAVEKFERSDIAYAPVLVFVSVFSVQMFLHTVGDAFSWYAFMMLGLEAGLSFILTLIMIQAIPIFTLSRRNYQLRHEEIICLMILLASVMTGTVGWMIGAISIEHVLSRWLILIFAFVGGAPLGASVGVVMGLILSLASTEAIMQMSILAFAGLLAGLLKDGKKIAVAIGMLLGTSILSVYIGDQSQMLASFWESTIAAVLFMLIPKSVTHMIAKYVPGTQEHVKSQHEYAKRMRDITAGRVQQFSEVFRQLSRSFGQFSPVALGVKKDDDVGHFMNAIAEHSCSNCYRRKQCWDEQFYQTYKLMTDMMTEIEVQGQVDKRQIPAQWKKLCVRTEQVLDMMQQQYQLYQHDQHWKKQIHDSRQLVADQLVGVSQVMEDLAKEIKREGQELCVQEEQIRHALEELGLSIYSIDIICLDEGNVEIEICHQYTKGHDECRKIIAPLLSDIIGENIAVKSEEYTHSREGFYTVLFGSAKAFEVLTGIAGAAKGGELLSGDSYRMVELGNGKYAVALSDGMGNGERASTESYAALNILQQLLQSGMDEQLALKSVNSVLLLRSPDEIYATIDMAIIDMYTAQTTFLKTGSTPSFVKRGHEVMKISANNLPIGIIQDIDVDLVKLQLKPDDLLIMMTDGIFDAPGPAVNKEMWMKRVIQEIETNDPQDIADCILETVVRYQSGTIVDDMTVLVAKVEKHQPEWATFSWPGMARLERPKTVS